MPKPPAETNYPPAPLPDHGLNSELTQLSKEMGCFEEWKRISEGFLNDIADASKNQDPRALTFTLDKFYLQGLYGGSVMPVDDARSLHAFLLLLKQAEQKGLLNKAQITQYLKEKINNLDVQSPKRRLLEEMLKLMV